MRETRIKISFTCQECKNKLYKMGLCRSHYNRVVNGTRKKTSKEKKREQNKRYREEVKLKMEC